MEEFQWDNDTALHHFSIFYYITKNGVTRSYSEISIQVLQALSLVTEVTNAQKLLSRPVNEHLLSYQHTSA